MSMRTTDPALERLVRRIVERADPVAIHLFGSRATGEADEESDYDLLVVLDDDFPVGRATPSFARSLVAGSDVPVDIVVVRAGTFARRSREVGTLSYEARHHGVLVHERGRRTRVA